MLIIEGPDGGGKTTLVSKLTRDLGLEPRPRSSSSTNGPVDDLLGWVQRDAQTNVHAGVYDRHPLVSETIYGPLIRGGDARLGWDEEAIAEAFEKLYLTSPLAIIYCLPSQAAVRTNIAQNHEATTEHLRGVLKHTDQLWSAYYYRYLMDMSRGVAIRWNYEDALDSDMYSVILRTARVCTEGRNIG